LIFQFLCIYSLAPCAVLYLEIADDAAAEADDSGSMDEEEHEEGKERGGGQSE